MKINVKPETEILFRHAAASDDSTPVKLMCKKQERHLFYRSIAPMKKTRKVVSQNNLWELLWQKKQLYCSLDIFFREC